MDPEQWEGTVQVYWEQWGGKGVVVTDLLSVEGGRRAALLRLSEQWARGEIVRVIPLTSLRRSETLSRHRDPYPYGQRREEPGADRSQTTAESFMRVKHAILLALRLDDAWNASEQEFQRLWKLYQAGLAFGQSSSLFVDPLSSRQPAATWTRRGADAYTLQA